VRLPRRGDAPAAKRIARGVERSSCTPKADSENYLEGNTTASVEPTNTGALAYQNTTPSENRKPFSSSQDWTSPLHRGAGGRCGPSSSPVFSITVVTLGGRVKRATDEGGHRQLDPFLVLP
jgi:hypothetical protein